MTTETKPEEATIQNRDLRTVFSADALMLLHGVTLQMKKRSNRLNPTTTEDCNTAEFSMDYDQRGDSHFITITGHKEFQARVYNTSDSVSEEDVRFTYPRLIWDSVLGRFFDKISGIIQDPTPRNVLMDTQRKDPSGFTAWEPDVQMSTTSTRFRATLRQFRKKESFCVATNENAISIFSRGDEEPVRSFGANKEYSSTIIAGLPFSIMNEILYSRKASHIGLVNRLTELGIDFNITEYGVCKDRIYVKITAGEATLMLLFEGITPSRIDLPNIPTTARQRRGATQHEMSAVTSLENWSKEDRERIQAWRRSHQQECDAKNKPYSDSIQRWFSDHLMILLRSGESASELDLDIMSRI